MVHFSIGHCGNDRLFFHGRLIIAHAHILYFKESDYLGVSLMDEDLLHESVAQKIWLTFRQGWTESELEVFLQVRFLTRFLPLSLEHAKEASKISLTYYINNKYYYTYQQLHYFLAAPLLEPPPASLCSSDSF